MLFNSWEYVALLAITFSLYWIIPVVAIRQGILLLACLAFYMAWNPAFVPLLVGLVMIHWAAALWLQTATNQARFVLRQRIFIGAIALSLVTLGYFKYATFFLDNLTYGLQFIGINFAPQAPDIILPLGISFYTFQLIAYTADVYRSRVAPERNPFTLLLFISFFPQLIAGPICRTTELLPQLKSKQSLQLNNLVDGLFALIAGFFLKSSIADGIAPYVNVIFDAPNSYSGYDNLMGAIAFGIQIYGDFCGYSLMAVGSARLLGYQLPFNFNLPYIAHSLQNFWRRWHITLSNWLKDYLYIPLGGSKGTQLATYRNLLITMVLGGIWHGASWTFFVWGLLHGIALAIERAISQLKTTWQKAQASDAHPPTALPPALSTSLSIGISSGSYLWTFTIVTLSWIFFRASSLPLAYQQISTILTPNATWLTSSLENGFYELIILFIPMQFILHYYTAKVAIGDRPITACILFPIATSLSILLSIIYYTDSADFIYFQF